MAAENQVILYSNAKIKKKKSEKGTENHRKIENQNYESEDSEEDEGNQVAFMVLALL